MINEIAISLWEISKDEILNNKKLKNKQILIYEPTFKKFALFYNTKKSDFNEFISDFEEDSKFFIFENYIEGIKKMWKLILNCF